MELVLQKNDPGKWAGPSVMVSGSSIDDSGERSFLGMSGFFLHLADWERKWSDRGSTCRVGNVTMGIQGDIALASAGGGNYDSVELHIITASDEDVDQLAEMLEFILPPHIYDNLWTLPPVNSITVNANRDMVLPDSWVENDVQMVDLPVNSIPSTRSGSLPLIAATRWVRVIAWPKGLMVIWRPPVGQWGQDEVRWPHNAVPSRSGNYLQECTEHHVEPERRVNRFFCDTIIHEEYFLGSWFTEIETWETHLFNELSTGESGFQSLDLPRLQRDLGTLADYLARARLSQRFYLRRAEVSELVRRRPDVVEMFCAVSGTMDQKISDGRISLRASFELLNTASQGAQAYAAERNQKASERLNVMVTTVTAVLLVPSLVASVYGANVRELAPDARGSVPLLLVLMLGLSTTSFGAIGVIRHARVRAFDVTLICLGLVIAAFGVMSASLSWPG